MAALEHSCTMIFGAVGLTPGYTSILKPHKDQLIRIFGDGAHTPAFYRGF